MSSVDLLLTLGLELAKITKNLLDKKTASREEKEKAVEIVEQYKTLKQDYVDLENTLETYYHAVDTAMATFGDYSKLNYICSQDYRHEIIRLVNNLSDNSYHSRIIHSFEILSIFIKEINTTKEGRQVKYWTADALILEKWNLFKNDRSVEACELIVKYHFQHHGKHWIIYDCHYYTEMQLNSPIRKFLPPIQI